MRKNEINMCEGPLLGSIIVYAVPLVLTNIIQLFFQMADVAVLGQFVGDDAVAAVGANGSLITLITSLFIGLSVGSNVLVARAVGENRPEKARLVVGTSVSISLIFGFVLAAVGWFGARTFLTWMNCDPDVIDMAVKYLRIYMLGMPVIMLYNFCASILRAVGDTLRPLLYLIFSGVANIGLNIFFVVVLHMDVEGVAIATVVSQCICAVLAIIAMTKNTNASHLDRTALPIDLPVLGQLCRIGIPSGLQSSMFSLSNVMIQSSINSLGKTVMSGGTVASQIDGVLYLLLNGFALASMAFTSQNLGAGKLGRIRQIFKDTIIIISILGAFVGAAVFFFGDLFCRIITSNPAVIDVAVTRLTITGLSYFLCGYMDTTSYTLRALGKSFISMVISILGVCVLRLVWVWTVFGIPRFHTYGWLFVIYPISWLVVFIVQYLIYRHTMRELEKAVPDTATAM